MKLVEILTKLDELTCRVGRNGLYMVDDYLTLLITDWRDSKFWKSIGKDVLHYQGEDEGVYLGSLFTEEDVLTSPDFPNFGKLDDKIRGHFQGGRHDLMSQYKSAQVIIHATPAGDYIVFNENGEDLYILADYVYMLSKLNAQLMASKSTEKQVSFCASPGVIGLLEKIAPDIEPDEPANETLEECQTAVAEFEIFFARQRRKHGFGRNPQLMIEVRSEIVDLLRRISGYENHRDREFNTRVDDILEEVFPVVTLSTGISYSIRGSDYFDTAHPERFQYLETDGKNWYTFISDWDQGFSEELGSHVPITEKTAKMIKHRIPSIPVRR